MDEKRSEEGKLELYLREQIRCHETEVKRHTALVNNFRLQLALLLCPFEPEDEIESPSGNWSPEIVKGIIAADNAEGWAVQTKLGMIIRPEHGWTKVDEPEEAR